MVFACGDTHIPWDIHRLLSFEKYQGFTKDDIMIVLGDFGLIWKAFPDDREMCWTDWLDDRPYTIMFVDGNHENHFRLSRVKVIKKFGGKVGKISRNIFHLKRGEIYTIEGKTFFTFGGAESYDKERRLLGISIWKEEVPSNEEMEYGLKNLEKHNNEVNFILSHTAPTSFLNRYFKKLKLPHDKYINDPTVKYLDHIISNMKFDRLYCSHFHDDFKTKKMSMIFEKTARLI